MARVLLRNDNLLDDWALNAMPLLGPDAGLLSGFAPPLMIEAPIRSLCDLSDPRWRLHQRNIACFTFYAFQPPPNFAVF